MALTTITPAATSAVASTAVAADALDATGPVSEPKQATYVLAAIVLSAVVFFVGVGGGLLVYNGDPATAFGVGLFTAFWGGPGFGVMAGMALYNLKVERLSA